MYVYAHNGSKFDAIPVIYSILVATEEPVEDMLESNGRFISFRWKHFISGTLSSLLLRAWRALARLTEFRQRKVHSRMHTYKVVTA